MFERSRTSRAWTIVTQGASPLDATREDAWTKHRSCPQANEGFLRTLKPRWCRQSRILRLLPSVTRARFCCGDSDGFDSARASCFSFSCRSSRFRRCRQTYGIARQQLTPQVGQARAPAARSAATLLPRSRWRSVTTWASCRHTIHTSQCFASRSHLFNWSGSRGRLPTLRVATKRFICCAVLWAGLCRCLFARSAVVGQHPDWRQIVCAASRWCHALWVACGHCSRAHFCHLCLSQARRWILAF